MQNRQRTPLALAIEEIKKNGWINNNDRTVVLSILESLKPKEREILESMYVKGTREEFYDATEESCKVVFDLNLTQE